MRLSITLLGLPLFAVELETATPEYELDTEPGESTSYPISFAGTHEAPDMAGPYREGWE